MDYRWDKGFRIAFKKEVDANVFGRHVEAMRSQMGNGITPFQVVEEARPLDSDIHALFEWDDAQAAEEWRIVQARNALNSIRIVVRQAGEVDRLVIANIHIREEGQHAYLPSQVVISNPELLDKAIQEALVYMRSWEARYRDIADLAPIFAALREAEAQVMQTRSRRRSRQSASV